MTAMKTEPRTKLGRREFLRTLGVGAGAAATLPLTGAEASADTETDAEKRKPRYHVTEDVKNYYRVNRYPQK
jgi:hypothetical protein